MLVGQKAASVFLRKIQENRDYKEQLKKVLVVTSGHSTPGRSRGEVDFHVAVLPELTTVLIKEGYTFPRHVRLLSSRDFQAVFRDNSSRLSDQNWTLLARQNKFDYARLGMAISKRVLNRAVDRNRIKRIVRESFRSHQIDLCGLDVIVMCKGDVKQMVNMELFDSLNGLWIQVKNGA
jgi:ribonuclease P protein component